MNPVRENSEVVIICPEITASLNTRVDTGGFNPTYPSEKDQSSSIGMMTFPSHMEKYKSCSSHHQAVMSEAKFLRRI